MADTSKLQRVTDYILADLSNRFSVELTQRKVKVGTNGIQKKFSGVSKDASILVHVCHHSGLTKGGNIPVGKLNGLYSKCYLMEKAHAKK